MDEINFLNHEEMNEDPGEASEEDETPNREVIENKFANIIDKSTRVCP